MNRRGFLGLFGTATAALAAGEELWTPGRKLISIPRVVVPQRLTGKSYGYDFHLSAEDMLGGEARLLERFVKPSTAYFRELVSKEFRTAKTLPLKIPRHIGYGKLISLEGIPNLRVTTMYDHHAGGNVGRVDILVDGWAKEQE